MPIYTIDQLRSTAPKEFRDLSDEDLVQQYSQYTGTPFEQAADFYGVKPRGTFSEMGRQAVGGAVVDLPKMVGQGLQYTGIAPQYGKEMAQAAEARAPQYAPDMRGRGLLGQAGVLGARGLAPVLATAPLALIPGVGEVAAAGAAATLFGTSSAQETYDKLVDQGIDPKEAAAAARRVGMIQGPLEGLATFTGARAAKGLAPIFGLGGKTTAGVAGELTDTSVARPFLKSMGVNAVVQPGTEVAQDLGTYAVEQAYGAQKEDPYEIARQSALGGLGLTMLLGPLSLGGHVARSRRAESLKQALYGEDTPTAVRAKAMDLVMGEAKRQGVAPENIDAWFDQQLQLEDQRNDALKQAEEQQRVQERDKQINLMGEAAQGLEGLQGGAFSSLDQQRKFEQGIGNVAPSIQGPFGSLDQQQTFEQGLTATRDANIARVGGEYQDLMANRMAGQMAAEEPGQQFQALQAKREQGLQAAQDVGAQWQEIKINKQRTQFDIEEMGREWQKMQSELPQPVTAPLTAGQKAALRGPEGKRLKPTSSPLPARELPTATTLLPTEQAPSTPLLQQPAAPMSQLTERPVEAAPVSPLVAQAATLPSAPAAGGVSSTPATTTTNGTQTAQAQQTKTKKQKAPITVGSVVKINDKEVTLSQEQADAWNKAQEAYDGKARRARELTNYQEREGALRAAGMQLSAERRKITGALTGKEQEAANRIAAKQTAEQKAQDDMGLTAALQTANRTNVANNPLQAGVQGAEKKPVPGKTSLTVNSLRNIRDALLNPSATVEGISDKEQKIADAVRAFAKSYYKFSNAGGNMLRGIPTERAIKGENGETIYKPTKLASQTPAQQRGQIKAKTGARVSTTLDLLGQTRQALAGLGEAVGGNAKDVEAIVKLVKDMVQQKLHTEINDEGMNEDFGQEGADGVAQAFQKMDTMLSQGWRAAKDNMFQGASDAAFVRQTPIRSSKEATAAGEIQTPLEKAALGYAKFGKGESSTGVLGVLNYIQTHGTPFERTIAKGVFQSLYDSDTVPSLEFITEGKPYYDPKTNTVYIQRDASAAVTLHETLHSALQWYVYQNPNAPEVRALKAALKQVVNYKGELSPDAQRVQDVLKTLMKDKKELDGVLELISYGNTLNDFRRALEAMDSKEAPKSFYDAAKNVWQTILTTVQKLIGVRPSVAADVIGNTFKLLEAAGSGKKGVPAGNILEAAVESTKPLSDAKVAEALGVSEQDYSRFNKSNAVQLQLTQRAFETVGWNQANMEKLTGKAGDKMREFISKNFPGTEIVLGLINSRYNISNTVSQIMDRYKLNKGIGYQYAEDLANVISRRPAEDVNSLFAYLDGDKKALDKLPDATKLKAVADKLDEWFKLYVKELTPVEQRYFNSRKFSESLLFPERTEQVAGSTFGLGKINAVLGLKRKSETELDQNWFQKDDNGDLVLDGDVYQVFEPNKATPAGGMISAGFMSVARFAELNNANPMGFTVDTTRRWLFEGMKGNQYSFVTNTTAKEKIADQKANDVANALRNTIAALANNYASKHFIKSVYEMGRGDSAHTQVAFDSLEELNKAFGTNVLESQVLPISREISRSPQTKSLYRQSGTWVKIPENSPVYGELSGKYLPGPVWNAMGDMSDRQPIIPLRTVNNVMRWFKKSKTVWNFGTHVTNTASNVTMAMLHDISFSTMGDASRILAKYEVSPKSLNKDELALMMAFRDSGAMLADYSSAEVKEALYKAHADNLRGGEDVSVMRRVAGWLEVEKSKAEAVNRLVAKAGKFADRADEVTSQMYAAEDNIFRLAAFLKTAGALQNRAGLKTPTQEMLQEAGLFARKAFGDYDIDSKAVKIGRQTVMPFISWFYAMAPVIGRIAVYEPWKLTNVLMAYMILEAAMGSAAGDDEEKRKEGPNNIRERLFGSIGPYTHIRIPFMGDDKNPVYYNLGDYFPTSAFTRGLPNGLAGQSWIPASLTPSGPFVSSILGLVGGVDPYTGKSLHQPTDTEWQKLWTSTKFAYDTVTVPTINSKTISKVNDMIDEKSGITGAEPSSLFIARAFGLKFYDFNEGEQAATNVIIRKRIEHDFKSAMTKAKRDEYRKGYPDYEALDATLNDLQTRMHKELDKARGEE